MFGNKFIKFLNITAQHIDEGFLVAYVGQEVVFLHYQFHNIRKCNGCRGFPSSSPLVRHIFCGTAVVTNKDDNCSTILRHHILAIHVTELPICGESLWPWDPMKECSTIQHILHFTLWLSGI